MDVEEGVSEINVFLYISVIAYIDLCHERRYNSESMARRRGHGRRRRSRSCTRTLKRGTRGGVRAIRGMRRQEHGVDCIEYTNLKLTLRVYAYT